MPAAASTASAHHRRAIRSSGIALLIAALSLITVVSPILAKRSLTNGSANPRSGTTSTLFAFRVDSGNPRPASVTARLTRGTSTISIGLNPPATGSTWTRTANVASAGTWTLTFIGSDRTSAPGGTITVTIAATARPSPTARPTARPTPAPTSRPATPRPSSNATPGHSSHASPTARPRVTPPSTPIAVGGATQPSSQPGAGSSNNDAGRMLPAVLLGLLVILGVGGIALLTGRREAEERPNREPVVAPDAPAAPEFVRRAAAVGAAEGAVDAARPRQRAAWELYSNLDNQPLGSVDEYLPGETTALPTDPGVAGPEPSEADARAAEDEGGAISRGPEG